jgi:hypothetical protein
MSYLEKIKSKIYQYFGVYLFLQQEYDYICSKKYWKEHAKLRKKNKDMDDEEIQGLLIGMWQLQYELHRPFNYWSLKFRKYPIISQIAIFLENLHTGCIQIKWDLVRFRTKLLRKRRARSR